MFKKICGLGIVFLLFGAVFLLTPTQGTKLEINAANIIYVDASHTTPPFLGTPSDPFRFIQDGIDNATNGDTIHVAQGTYNERLLLNKSITLTGAGKPVINAGGGNAINVTIGGIVINNFNITNAYYGVNVTIRDLKNLYDFTLVGGDIAITNNTIDASYTGVYFYTYDFGYGMHGNSNVTIGDTRVKHNTITSDHYGIYIDIEDVGSSLYDASTFTMGNIDFCDNTITSSYDGIYIDYLGYIGYDLYNNARFKMGHLRINNNTVTSGDYGICNDDTEYFGTYLYDNAQFEMGNIEYNNNTISSRYEGILFWDTMYFGSSMYGNSSFTMGNFQVNGNHVTSTDDDGICSYGYFDYFGSSMYDTTVFTMGNVQFNDNAIDSAYYGIDLGYIWDFGYYNEGNSTFTMGNIEINNNQITSYNIAIYVEAIEDFGCNLEDNARVTVKDIQVNNNQITSENFEGIYIYGIYYIGNDMYNNSRFNMGNIEISQNQINSPFDEAIVLYDIEDFGTFMYNQSSVTMGNFLVHDNIIATDGSPGIYQYILDFQTHTSMQDNATFTMGTVEFYNNKITNCREGMYFTNLENATIKQNTIQNCDTGIYLSGENNHIYHNNFNNTVNALDNGINTWDNGYNGGNWWSDYVGLDLNSGLHQNEPFSDGLGDASYVINGTVPKIDRYPLKAPFSTFNAGTWGANAYFVDIASFSTLSNFSFDVDNKTIKFIVEGETGTNDMCRVAIPRSLLWCENVAEWTVKIDESGTTRNVFDVDDGYTYIYFEYVHSGHTVEIEGTQAVPEFMSLVTLMLLVIAASIFFTANRRRMPYLHN